MSGVLRFAVVAAFVVVGLYLLGSSVAFVRHVAVDSGRPPIESRQVGYRGTGLVQLYNPREMETLAEANVIPTSVPFPGTEGDRAGDVYSNVKVLGDVSAGQFTRLMVNMTTWVAAEEGCAGCHNVANFAEDSLYTKVVARRMLEMVRDINANWTRHVADTGVTCYTCHRGKLVPQNIWFTDPSPQKPSLLFRTKAEENFPAPAVATTVLPRDAMSSYLEGDEDVRVQATDAMRARGGESASIKETQRTYSLMMHISQALGVNCDYCHNTRAMRDWEQSRPQRVTAWHGIRMVRTLNNEYLNPLRPVFPAHRLGEAMGDAPKVNCATCHNGVFKPLFGEAMVKNFPELVGVPAARAELRGALETTAMTAGGDTVTPQ